VLESITVEDGYSASHYTSLKDLADRLIVRNPSLSALLYYGILRLEELK
jgi:hypothetical protein